MFDSNYRVCVNVKSSTHYVIDFGNLEAWHTKQIHVCCRGMHFDILICSTSTYNCVLILIDIDNDIPAALCICDNYHTKYVSSRIQSYFYLEYQYYLLRLDYWKAHF